MAHSLFSVGLNIKVHIYTCIKLPPDSQTYRFGWVWTLDWFGWQWTGLVCIVLPLTDGANIPAWEEKYFSPICTEQLWRQWSCCIYQVGKCDSNSLSSIWHASAKIQHYARTREMFKQHFLKLNFIVQPFTTIPFGWESTFVWAILVWGAFISPLPPVTATLDSDEMIAPLVTTFMMMLILMLMLMLILTW